MSTSRQKHAFTLIELLVVIAIIGLLIGLVLPAANAARESGRRVRCLNNLHQLGIAMQAYESAHRRLPPGYVSQSTTTPPPATRDPTTWDAPPGWGWGTHLLPYLDESGLASSVNLDEPVWSERNTEFVRQTVPTFLCPTASGGHEPFVVQDETGAPLSIEGRTVTLGRSHYVANHGQESCWGECGANPTGIVFTNIYTSETREITIKGDF